MENKKIVYSDDLSLDCPKVLLPFIANLRDFNVESIMIVGLWRKGNLVGAIGVDYISRKHKFNPIDGRMLSSAASVIDISQERTEFIEDLEKSQREKLTIMNSMDIPAILFDEKLQILSNNKAAEGLAQYIPNLMLGDNCPCVLKLKKCLKLDCIFKKLIATKKEQNAEVELNGRWYSASSKPILDKRGDLTNILCTLVDMTDFYQRKRDMEKAILAEQSANRAKSLFIATMSHEVRTPLNAILGFAELSQDPSISEVSRAENMLNIKSAANALLSILNDVLDLSNLESGKIKLTQTPCDVRALIESVSGMFDFEAMQKNIKNKVAIDSNIPLLMLDKKHLRQILVNILGNAVKFTKEGCVQIDASYCDNSLSIAISDTGCGIAEEFLNKIFKPFEQQPHMLIREQRVEGGAGIGLSIAKKLAENMGGEISVKSELGKGSTFTLHLKNLKEVSVETLSENVKNLSESVPQNQTLSKNKISVKRPKGLVMILDDVEMNLKVLGGVLKKMQFEYIVCSSAREALEKLQQAKPALILSDIWMPNINGDEFAKRVRSDKKFDDVPIVAFTADTQINNSANIFDDVIFKPLNPKLLNEVLGKYFELLYPINRSSLILF